MPIEFRVDKIIPPEELYKSKETSFIKLLYNLFKFDVLDDAIVDLEVSSCTRVLS